jgi:hypothetical protein
MKTIVKHSKFAAICFAALASFSCSNEDPISSRVTYYPLITVMGEDQIIVERGETFNDPGATATIEGEEVPLDVRFVGQYRGNVFNNTLDTNVSDIYTQEFTATNEEGFSRTLTREVIVAETGDLVNSIAGLYRSTVFRNGSQGSPASAYTDIEYILIWENEDGTYGISDAFGGWYLFARAIPDSETPGGIIVANNIAANDFEFPGTLTNSYFGGSAQITDMTVNPDDNSIDLTTVWQADPATTYTFNVHLEQVQF